MKKELLKNILCVIVKPHYGWERVSESQLSPGLALSGLYYPLLGLLALACFFPMVYDHTITVSHSLMTGIIEFSSFFITYFITSYLLEGFYPELAKTRAARNRLNDFIVYNLVFLVLLKILRYLLPSDFTPVLFLMLYMPWMVYRATEYLEVRENKVTKFVVIASALIMGLPIAINYFLSLFIITR